MASLENAAAVWCAIALRITIGISLGSIVLALILRAVPRTSPDLRHRLWGLVILQGLCWFRIPIGLPWLNGELPGKAVPTNQLTEAASISSLRSPSDIPNEELPASSDSWGSDSVSSSAAPSIRSHFVTAGLVTQVLAVAWMCVVVVLLSLLALRFRRFRRELMADVRPVSSALVADLNGLSWRHGIGRPVRLAESRVCCVPMLVGIMRPTILLPSATLDLPRAELQTLLAHELGHLKKHHWVFTGLSLISCVLNFFNPFVWWSRKRLIDAREESADRWVTESGGQSPTAYARALVAVAQMLSRPQAVWIGAAQSPSHLRKRVEAILDVSRARARSSAWTGVVLTVVLAATVLLSPVSFRPNQSVLGQNAPGKFKSAEQDTAAQEQVEALPPGVLRVFGSERLRTWGEAFSLALSQDGKTLAVGSPGGLMLVDWRSGKTLKVLPSTSQPTSVSFNPEGKLVATGDESGIVEIWDIVEGVMVRNIAADTSAVWSVVFSPDGESLITGGIDGSIKFWEVATGKLQRQWQAHAASEARRSHGVALGATQDGKHLVSGHGDGLVRVFEASSGALLHSFQAHDPAHMGVGGVAISRDGTYIASCGLEVEDLGDRAWETDARRADLQRSSGRLSV
jgi:beta-lactamase regulating signal transducer with metallopeptidase domain